MSTEPDIIEGEIDPSPYIRTYAKDLAALSGKDPDGASAAGNKGKHPVKKEKPPKKIKKRSGSPVTADLSGPGLQTEDAEKQVQDNLKQLQATAQTEAPEVLSLPRITPGDIVPQGQVPVASAEAAKESADILARLKARALEDNASRAVPTPPPISQANMIPANEAPSLISKIT